MCLQVNLAQNLTAAFWKYSGMADGEDGDEDADDMGECCVVSFVAYFLQHGVRCLLAFDTRDVWR
jgi:hypothetical protein